jgi:peroxiredoxin
MYCPYCQAEAPNINKLYDLIESNPELKGRIKLVGVGAGNTPYEVDIFRKKFSVPFPLFADDNFAIQKSSGGRPFRTPTFIVLRKQGATHYRLIEVHQGRIDKIEEFLNRVSRF